MGGSPKLQLSKADLLAVLRGALLAMGGALVTYVSTQVVPHLDQETVLGAVIAGTASTVLNALRKFLSDTRG